MKVHIVAKMAREFRGQVHGENVLGEVMAFTVVKAFKEKSDLQEFMSKVNFLQVEKINNVDCMVEIGVIEDIEVEGTE